MTETVSSPADTENAIAAMKAKSQNVSALIANNPDSPLVPAARAEIEAEIKAELLKDVSLEEVRDLIQFIRGGGLKRPQSSNDAADEFDEYGRNFRRMVHRMEVTGISGAVRVIERPMARTLKEARDANPPSDYYDPDEGTWILYGIKRQRNRPENEVGFDGVPGR